MPSSHTKMEVLEAAIATVAERGVPYGGVEQNFDRIAKLWNAWLSARGWEPTLAPTDVSAMMILMKLGRLAGNDTHMDSWIDIAGYAGCGGELAGNRRA